MVEQSSLPLIALFWPKIGRCRGRNRLYGNQALQGLQQSLDGLFELIDWRFTWRVRPVLGHLTRKSI